MSVKVWGHITSAAWVKDFRWKCWVMDMSNPSVIRCWQQEHPSGDSTKKIFKRGIWGIKSTAGLTNEE